MENIKHYETWKERKERKEGRKEGKKEGREGGEGRRFCTIK